MVNLYTKEGVESLHILPYTSTNVHIVNGQRWNSKQSMVKALKISVVNGQKAEESLVKVLTFSHNSDYRLYGSDTPHALTDEFLSLEDTCNINW